MAKDATRIPRDVLADALGVFDSAAVRWGTDAACIPRPGHRHGLNGWADVDRVFYPEGAGHRNRYDLAAQVCAGCPIAVKCLDVALLVEAGTHQSRGYRGRMTPGERDQVLAEIRAEVA